jgi:hypothetical protein
MIAIVFVLIFVVSLVLLLMLMLMLLLLRLQQLGPFHCFQMMDHVSVWVVMRDDHYL